MREILKALGEGKTVFWRGVMPVWCDDQGILAEGAPASWGCLTECTLERKPKGPTSEHAKLTEKGLELTSLRTLNNRERYRLALLCLHGIYPRHSAETARLALVAGYKAKNTTTGEVVSELPPGAWFYAWGVVYE